MIIAPMAEGILRSIRDFAQDATKDARNLRVRCPQCGGLVMKKELEERGCYLCGWKHCDETIKSGAQKRKRPYRTRCTRCGTMNVTKQLMARGCYVCGLKPIALESDYGTTREERARAGSEEQERLLEERPMKELSADPGQKGDV
ncbi:MAG: hypothetical protein L6435_11810 [Anaerolineae bacterium]|nr:hypothetical protein [Anaerolineae bacterium]